MNLESDGDRFIVSFSVIFPIKQQKMKRVPRTWDGPGKIWFYYSISFSLLAAIYQKHFAKEGRESFLEI